MYIYERGEQIDEKKDRHFTGDIQSQELLDIKIISSIIWN